ncbi:hypothetical protein [Streptomyces albicerus]|uniref:hypothetical protein n=1 Tax=Streptomyces albicerus TaxID=2569859 RepID=UPI00124BB76E|nr:hypothetical protein [Streptomyces albicerus]
MTPIAQGPISSTADSVITAESAIWLIGLAGWAARDWFKHRRPELALLICSAAAAVLAITIACPLINVRHFPSDDAVIAYSAFGRDFALWLFLKNTAWMGTAGYLVMKAAERGWSARRLWGLYAAAVVFEVVAEAVMVKRGFYLYDGSQPARMFGIPFAWPFILTAVMMLFGLAAFQFFHHVHGRQRLLLLPAASGAVAGACVCMGWPLFLGGGMNLSTPAMSALGVLSTSAALLTLHIMLRWLDHSRTQRDSPQAGDEGKPPSPRAVPQSMEAAHGEGR